MDNSRLLRIGIVGCGNLGKATLRLLEKKKDIWLSEGLHLSLTCVLDVNGGVADKNGLDCGALAAHMESGQKFEKFPGFDTALNFGKVLEERLIDVLVELTPTNKDTGEPGLTYIRKALENGVHVATSNKGPIMVAWEELSELARARKLLLGIGCTTGGALPSVIAGREAMAGADVSQTEGILNGTTNFILSRMESGLAYEEALKEAQAAGIAETDPSMDVEGWDTAVKLLILAKVVMGGSLSLKDISVTGITHVTPEEIRQARDAGDRIKLVGRAWREGGQVRASVAPERVAAGHPFHSVSQKDKCVRYVSDTLGDLFVSGGASGPGPAAASALRDILNAWRTGLLR